MWKMTKIIKLCYLGAVLQNCSFCFKGHWILHATLVSWHLAAGCKTLTRLPLAARGLRQYSNWNYVDFLYSYKSVFWKFSDLAYNRCETRDKRPLGRDPDRSWCYFHTSVKLTCVLRSVHGSMGCDQESFSLVWLWHQPLFGSLPNGHLSQVSCQL